MIQATALLDNLTLEEVRQILRFTAPMAKNFTGNQIILDQGQAVSCIGMIQSGTVMGMKYHFGGEAQILRVYREGEVLSLDAINTYAQTSPVTLVSQRHSTVLFFSYQKLMQIEQVSEQVKAQVLHNINQILSNECIRLMYKIDVLSKRTLEERVLTYLSIIREKRGREVIDIRMNQEQFAQYLCVNRSVLSKELNRMRKEKVIDYQKSKYVILSK